MLVGSQGNSDCKGPQDNIRFLAESTVSIKVGLDCSGLNKPSKCPRREITECHWTIQGLIVFLRTLFLSKVDRYCLLSLWKQISHFSD